MTGVTEGRMEGGHPAHSLPGWVRQVKAVQPTPRLGEIASVSTPHLAGWPLPSAPGSLCAHHGTPCPARAACSIALNEKRAVCPQMTTQKARSHLQNPDSKHSRPIL